MDEFIDKYLRIDIVDTGIGIKEENIKKMFKFFGKLNSSAKFN